MAVFDEATGKMMEMRNLIRHPNPEISKIKTDDDRRLWLSPEDLLKLNNCNSRRSKTNVEDDAARNKTFEIDIDNSWAYEKMFENFSSKPEPKSLVFLLKNTMVFVQEFVLTCLVLAGHRAAQYKDPHYLYEYEHKYRQRFQQQDHHDEIEELNNIVIHKNQNEGKLLASLGLIWLTLVVAVVKNRFANSKHYSIKHRFTDFLLMAILLRFLSAVLKTLTASYSSDTVYALSIISLFLHLITCNYDYANGLCADDKDDNNNNNEDESTSVSASLNSLVNSNNHICWKRNQEQRRPTFKGGMISLTSAFFATTLLASRLESNAAVYIFVCSSVVLFALYPAARHLVAVRSKHVGKWIPNLVSGILFLALIILLEPTEILILSIVTSFIGIFVPIWKYNLQFFKIRLRGPWDIAHV